VILLDTHALVWWVAEPSRLGARARRAVDTAIQSKETVFVSSITAWEIAMLVAAKRLVLTVEYSAWLQRVEDLPFVEFVPVDNRIAVRAVELEDFPHRDPADRIIVATALGLGATLLTADDRIRSYKRVRSLWS
jgi:PIN domain nuclease of toxin-antitoxin system